MMNGYMGTIIRVDLSKGTIKRNRSIWRPQRIL